MMDTVATGSGISILSSPFKNNYTTNLIRNERQQHTGDDENTLKRYKTTLSKLNELVVGNTAIDNNNSNSNNNNNNNNLNNLNKNQQQSLRFGCGIITGNKKSVNLFGTTVNTLQRNNLDRKPKNSLTSPLFDIWKTENVKSIRNISKSDIIKKLEILNEHKFCNNMIHNNEFANHPNLQFNQHSEFDLQEYNSFDFYSPMISRGSVTPSFNRDQSNISSGTTMFEYELNSNISKMRINQEFESFEFNVKKLENDIIKIKNQSRKLLASSNRLDSQIRINLSRRDSIEHSYPETATDIDNDDYSSDYNYMDSNPSYEKDLKLKVLQLHKKLELYKRTIRNYSNRDVNSLDDSVSSKNPTRRRHIISKLSHSELLEVDGNSNEREEEDDDDYFDSSSINELTFENLKLQETLHRKRDIDISRFGSSSRSGFQLHLQIQKE
ncbi:hypothetical protein Kpol_1030p44 [Vanderwaltozyma polyspora DSM 70294]|uniref:Uncharacterized protein n=1 Tax=Vanderwaltozyma polyspora (strain ATCC 22028 / DSM 70294 / BCRC 21397 / CBS 2163 / NBRC 10782 / NRRL Y-8283 / UCD 57-17) TaxID=436907 RepID=A7TMW2_VANPO|nr:uncharacterized protein Kpol_1030p44 [Vanderwaltozyma polyspora DSM 70294]EDO16434.1 hypothetical protein Kpol_1030p44 [Vanderwaltozyma polyspora DSM 70294]